MLSENVLAPKILNIGGGVGNALSLAQLDHFCKEHIDANKQIKQVPENRNFDIPLYISDCRLAKEYWGWEPAIKSNQLLEQILKYGTDNADYLKKLSS